jgi:hypothetical protein
MAHFDDLSPYAYAGNTAPGVVHVGWLGAGYDYSKGNVPEHLVETLVKLSSNLVELYRGLHICELCQVPEGFDGKSFKEQWEWEVQRSSNGEIRIVVDEVTFAAPQLIVHYIKEHGYRPPDVFLRAVESVALQLETEAIEEQS